MALTEEEKLNIKSFAKNLTDSELKKRIKQKKQFNSETIQVFCEELEERGYKVIDVFKTSIGDASSLSYVVIIILAIINFSKIKGRLYDDWIGETLAVNIGIIFGSLLAIFILYAVAKIIFSAIKIKKEKLSKKQSTLFALSLALLIKYLLDLILGR